MTNFLRQVPVGFDQEKIFPTSDRLLHGVRATLQKIAGLTGDLQSRAELRSIDAVLGELARRNQRQHYCDFYRDMRMLLEEGLALLRSIPQPRAAALIDLGADIERELATKLPPTLEATYAFEFLGQCVNRVLRHVAMLVEAMDDAAAHQADAFLKRVTARENEFQMHRMQFVQPQAQDANGQADSMSAESLQAYLRVKWPQRHGLRVSSFRQLVGGFQKVTILFDVEDDAGQHDSLVLRMGKSDRFVSLDFGDICDEFALVSFLHRKGARIAEPLLLEADESAFGNRFFISRKAAGENLGNSNMSSGISDGVARSFLDAIAHVHRIPFAEEMMELPLERWRGAATPRANTLLNIEYWRNQPWMKVTNPSPIAERLVSWLTRNIPDEDFTPCLVHCDYGPHNVLVHDGQVSAILDWESARIGDPAEDVSWFLQSCGGQVDYGKAINWYKAATGTQLSEFSLRYYDVFGCLKTMVASGSAAAMYEAHEDASIVWTDLHLVYTSYATRSIEERIRVAEAARK